MTGRLTSRDSQQPEPSVFARSGRAPATAARRPDRWQRRGGWWLAGLGGFKVAWRQESWPGVWRSVRHLPLAGVLNCGRRGRGGGRPRCRPGQGWRAGTAFVAGLISARQTGADCQYLHGPAATDPPGRPKAKASENRRQALPLSPARTARDRGNSPSAPNAARECVECSQEICHRRERSVITEAMTPLNRYRVFSGLWPCGRDADPTSSPRRQPSGLER